MFLGQVMSRLDDEAFAVETLLALGDLPLVVDLEATARRLGESMSRYAVDATRRFAALASDEDWLALVTAAEGAADPGPACLRQMLSWSLQQDREAR